jgi:hypothetical protein
VFRGQLEKAEVMAADEGAGSSSLGETSFLGIRRRCDASLSLSPLSVEFCQAVQTARCQTEIAGGGAVVDERERLERNKATSLPSMT